MLALAAVIALAACDRLPRDSNARAQAMAMTGANPVDGPTLMRHYGCISCHTIPGVRGADATVGPPLTAMARRTFIAGVLPNTPDNMVRWIMNPPAVDSLTAMPFLGVTPADARKMAAYLYTLR
ncbi:MAG TPA: c-type cytochrome [Gemmatimonadaceae bacterium]|nr:c-type cytochrome [Gemmatimonadaceae bacterium]